MLQSDITISPIKKVTAYLALENKKIKDLSKELRVTPSAMSKVIHGQSRSRKIEEELNKIVGEDLFPIKK